MNLYLELPTVFKKEMFQFIFQKGTNGKTILIDVKTFNKDTRWNGTWTNVSTPRSKEQIDIGVRILGFNPKTRKLRFVEHKI